MRSALALAAFTAGALAVPFGHRHHKRELVTKTDVVIKTAVVYVTAGQEAPTSVAAPAVTTTVTPVAVPTSTHSTVSERKNWGGNSVVVVTTVVTPNEAPSSTYVPPPPPSSSAQAPPKVVPQSAAPAPAAPSPQSAAPAPAAPSPQSAAPAPQSAAPQPSSTGGNDAPATNYQEIVVLHHNLHRRNHSAPDIEWSNSLATSAAIIAATCNYEHQMGVNGGGYGQNIAAGVDSQNVSAVITDLFYNGEVNWFDGLYGQANPDMGEFGHWGHFSQIVWKATTEVGCATQYCPGGLANTFGPVEPWFTVCNYGPEGNMGGGYGENIGQPLGQATAQWNTGL